MKKILIMCLAIVGSVLTGGSMMASVFAFVMITGLLVEHLWAQPARQALECPARIPGTELREGTHLPPA